MDRDELKLLFDRQAPCYDSQWNRMAPINNCLYFFLEPLLENLEEKARILCVGAGTGKEILFLANRFPQWHFTIVEPSGSMLNICREAIDEAGFKSRCIFHEGYLDTLPSSANHDAATCFAVSHFFLDIQERSEFFRQISDRLKTGGILVSSDLASDVTSDNYHQLLELWANVMSNSEISDKNIRKIKETYAKDVAILPPIEVASIIASAGFEFPVQFYQAGLIHAFFAKKPA